MVYGQPLLFSKGLFLFSSLKKTILQAPFSLSTEVFLSEFESELRISRDQNAACGCVFCKFCWLISLFFTLSFSFFFSFFCFFHMCSSGWREHECSRKEVVAHFPKILEFGCQNDKSKWTGFILLKCQSSGIFWRFFLIYIKLLGQQMINLHVIMHVSCDKFKLFCYIFISTTAFISYTLDSNDII